MASEVASAVVVTDVLDGGGWVPEVIKKTSKIYSKL